MLMKQIKKIPWKLMMFLHLMFDLVQVSAVDILLDLVLVVNYKISRVSHTMTKNTIFQL